LLTNIYELIFEPLKDKTPCFSTILVQKDPSARRNKERTNCFTLVCLI
ncbi:unnamed protein product, partial [Arabidopsis halleri]